MSRDLPFLLLLLSPSSFSPVCLYIVMWIYEWIIIGILLPVGVQDKYTHTQELAGLFTSLHVQCWRRRRSLLASLYTYTYICSFYNIYIYIYMATILNTLEEEEEEKMLSASYKLAIRKPVDSVTALCIACQQGVEIELDVYNVYIYMFGEERERMRRVRLNCKSSSSKRKKEVNLNSN